MTNGIGLKILKAWYLFQAFFITAALNYCLLRQERKFNIEEGLEDTFSEITLIALMLWWPVLLFIGFSKLMDEAHRPERNLPRFETFRR